MLEVFIFVQVMRTVFSKMNAWNEWVTKYPEYFITYKKKYLEFTVIQFNTIQSKIILLL